MLCGRWRRRSRSLSTQPEKRRGYKRREEVIREEKWILRKEAVTREEVVRK